MHQFIELYLVTIQSAASQKAARADLRSFLCWWDKTHQYSCSPDLLLHKDISAWMHYRQDAEERKATTINRGLSTMRSFGNWLVEEQYAHENPATHIQSLPTEEHGPRALPDVAVDTLLRVAQMESDPVLRLRDRALLALLTYAGLRSQEVADLQIRDIDMDGGTITVRKGKGRKPRRIPLHTDAQTILHHYIKYARCPQGLPYVGSEAEREPLLVSRSQHVSGRLIGPGMSTRMMRFRLTLLRTRAAEFLQASAAKEPNSVRATELRSMAEQLTHASPHTLRHSLARRMLRRGSDLSTIQRVLGHARLSTTGMYTIPNEDDVRQAIDRSGL